MPSALSGGSFCVFSAVNNRCNFLYDSTEKKFLFFEKRCHILQLTKHI